MIPFPKRQRQICRSSTLSQLQISIPGRGRWSSLSTSIRLCMREVAVNIENTVKASKSMLSDDQETQSEIQGRLQAMAWSSRSRMMEL